MYSYSICDDTHHIDTCGIYILKLLISSSQKGPQGGDRLITSQEGKDFIGKTLVPLEMGTP